MAWQQNKWFGAQVLEVARPGLESEVCTSFMLNGGGMLFFELYVPHW